MIIFSLIISIIELVAVVFLASFASQILLQQPTEYSDTFYSKLFSTLNISINSHNELILFSAILLSIVYIIKFICVIFMHKEIIVFGYEKLSDLHLKLSQNHLSQSYINYTKTSSADKINKIQNLSMQFCNGVLMASIKLIGEIFIIAAIITYLFLKSGIIVFVTFNMLLGLTILYHMTLGKKVKSIAAQSNKAYKLLVRSIQEINKGYKEINVLNKENLFLKKIENNSFIYSRGQAKVQVIGIIPRYLAEVVIVLLIVLVATVFLFVFDYSMKSITEMFSLFVIGSLRLLPSTSVVNSSLVNLRYGSDAISLLKKELTVGSEVKPKKVPDSNISFRSLELKNIFFKHQNEPGYVLKNISLSLNKGEFLGIMGQSGSGKTSILNIIAGFLDPTSGQININDRMVNSNNCRPSKRDVAYLPQDNFFIEDSIQENIQLGEVNLISPYEILFSLGLEDYIGNLNSGMDTIMTEGALNLSGGQRQRIVLARYFYHKKSLFLFDESTSALDIESEEMILNEINKLKGKISAIFVSHRKSTFKYCDKIYKIDNGELIQM